MIRWFNQGHGHAPRARRLNSSSELLKSLPRRTETFDMRILNDLKISAILGKDTLTDTDTHVQYCTMIYKWSTMIYNDLWWSMMIYNDPQRSITSYTKFNKTSRMGHPEVDLTWCYTATRMNASVESSWRQGQGRRRLVFCFWPVSLRIQTSWGYHVVKPWKACNEPSPTST